jgi:hypothetical protein
MASAFIFHLSIERSFVLKIILRTISLSAALLAPSLAGAGFRANSPAVVSVEEAAYDDECGLLATALIVRASEQLPVTLPQVHAFRQKQNQAACFLAAQKIGAEVR